MSHSSPSPRGWLDPSADVPLLIALGAVIAGGWPVILALRAPGPVQLVPVTAHVCGMLAGYGVIVMVALMSRAPALERGIGADVLARWHSRAGRLILGLVLLHAWAAVTAWAGSRHQAAAVALWHVLRLPYLMAATIGTVLLVGVAAASVRFARRRLSYERWHALHLLTYVAVALSFLHQLAGP